MHAKRCQQSQMARERLVSDNQGRTGIRGRIVNPAALIDGYAFHRATRLPTGADPG